MTRTQREQLERRLEANTQAAVGLFERFSAARLTHRPIEGSWSAAECVAHLSLTAAAAVPLLEAAVTDLRSQNIRKGSEGRMDWMGRLLRWSLEPPLRFKTRTTRPFEPLQSRAGE